MPARIYTPLPEGKGHFGERKFVEQLEALGNAASHLWAGVNYLPGGVPDIDTIFVQQDIGCFNIEVKAVSLGMIEEYGLNVCGIKDRQDHRHPLEQAQIAQIGFRQYFGAVSEARCPFLFATAAFPLIGRDEMRAKFSSPPLDRQYEGMLFADDLESTATLMRRLTEISHRPPKVKPPRDARPKFDQISALVEVLDPGAQPATGSPGDIERGEVLAGNVGRPGGRPSGGGPAAKYLVPGDRGPVIFRGHPGTGKTVQLQEIAIAHARAGRAVLFTCYNKVLASTLRAILATQDLGDAVDRRMVLTHVGELEAQLAEDVDSFKGIFGTICVDEAQDMSDSSFEFLKQLATDDAEWFLADGQGQELYGAASPFLEQSRMDGTIEQLRRSFRNRSAAFLVAQAVYEHAPNLDAIAGWVAKHPLRPADDEPLELDLGLPESPPGGELPRVLRVNADGSDWRQQKLDAYVAALFEELEKLASEGRPRDLAILCAQGDQKSFEAQRARDALRILGVPVHDQIDVAGRGHGVPAGHVRLSTIHSSRGVEASRVILLDVAHGISSKEHHQQNSRIMSYIALSRAQTATTIIAPADSDNPYLRFIEELVAAYRSADASPHGEEPETA